MRVAIAHDWMMVYGGAERCVEQMTQAFPGAPVLTATFLPEILPEPLRAAQPSFLQRVPGALGHHQWFLPVMPLAWRLRRPLDADAVVASSHACVNAVRVTAGTPILSYCYTPMRYAWDFHAERQRVPAAVRPLVGGAMRSFRRWDRRTSARVTRFVAISGAVAERIRRYYGREAAVVHPPVATDYYTPGGERGEDFLYVGRLVSYKRVDLVVEAFAGLPYRLLVVGDGALGPSLRARGLPNVEFLGQVGDEELRALYRRARALVFPAEEDFGIVMAEALACGCPVVGLAAGGALDIVEPEVSGWLVERQNVEDLRRAIRRAADERLDEGEVRRHAERFSNERFRDEIRGAVEDMVAAHGRTRAG